jgi:uncharacterized protein
MTGPSLQRESPGRIEAIDALRGFALIGIYFINITVMGGPIDMEQPPGAPDLANPDWQVWLASEIFVYGTMRGLFSILFGASALLFLGNLRRDPAAFMRRSVWLFFFGAINATLLLWPGDILMIYALASPIALVFRRAPALRLLLAAGAIVVVLSLWSYLDALAPATSDVSSEPAADLAREKAARLGGYLDNLDFMWRKSVEWLVTIGTLWWVLDAASFMLVGMGLFRLGFLSGETPRRIYAGLALLGFGFGWPLRAWGASTALANDGNFSPLAEASFQFGRLAVSLGWAGAFLLLWRLAPRLRFFFAPLSAIGRMAFTCYLSQSVIGAFVFSGFGLALWGKLDWMQMWALVPMIMAPLAVACMLWLSAFRMGPLEWLWRRLTFGRAPALKGRAAR